MSKKLNAAQITQHMKQGYGGMNAAYNRLKTNEKLVTWGAAAFAGVTVARAIKLAKRKFKRKPSEELDKSK